MKLGDEKDVNFTFCVKKTRLGRINAGTPFLYKGKLWIVLNRVQSGGKLIRTLVGEEHESLVKSSNTIIQHIIRSKKK